MPHSKCMNVKTQLECLPTTGTIALTQHGTLLNARTYTVGMRCHWWMAKRCKQFVHGIIASHATLGSKAHACWLAGHTDCATLHLTTMDFVYTWVAKWQQTACLLAGTMKRNIGKTTTWNAWRCHWLLLFREKQSVGKESVCSLAINRLLMGAMEKLAKGLLQLGEPGLWFIQFEGWLEFVMLLTSLLGKCSIIRKLQNGILQ